MAIITPSTSLFNLTFILILCLLSNVSNCTKNGDENSSTTQPKQALPTAMPLPPRPAPPTPPGPVPPEPAPPTPAGPTPPKPSPAAPPAPAPAPKPKPEPLPQPDLDMLEFPLNLEYLESEFFLHGALGFGLDKVAPGMSGGGPPSLGGRKAFLDPVTHTIIHQFGLIDLGHLRAIKKVLKPFPRPQINLSSQHFGHVMNLAVGYPLHPPFDPYRNSINFLLASYLIQYVSVTGAVGANAMLKSPEGKKLVAGLLAAEAGQDAVIRTLLYERRFEFVHPYRITVQEFTNKISSLRNKLGKGPMKDEGLLVDPIHGAEGKTPLNILSLDPYSIGYPRTAEQILSIFYGSGNASVPGGFFPKGAGGRVARSLLR